MERAIYITGVRLRLERYKELLISVNEFFYHADEEVAWLEEEIEVVKSGIDWCCDVEREMGPRVGVVAFEDDGFDGIWL